MAIVHLLLLTFCVFADPLTPADFDFGDDSVCGDGVFDSLNEECDGTPHCDATCHCEKGYTAEENGTCTISCIYGKACVNGCFLPDM